jgi:RsmE family RNA methyltransferase
MNLILLQPSDFTREDEVTLSDRRLAHIISIHKPEVGQTLKVGILGGNKGSGEVLSMSTDSIRLKVNVDTPPPQPLPVSLLLALPRPKMLKRILQTVAAMGVKEIYLLNTYRVDKSCWGSPVLERQVTENLLLGLEQAGDTIMPEVHLKKRFKPFVEDELPAISSDTRRIIAHPYHAQPCPQASSEPTTLAIGPEGGFIPYEVDKLISCGFMPIHIGERILRVETAVPALLSRLFPV